MSVVDSYIAAVNSADEDAIAVLLADGAVLRHPFGTYEGVEAILGFYRDVVFAGQAQTEITRQATTDGIAWAQIEATSPIGTPGNRTYAVDVFELDPDGRIRQLEIYYR